MDDLAQKLQALRLRLYEEGRLEELINTLLEIEALARQQTSITETTSETDAYDLLAHAFRALCEATRDNPVVAHGLILQRLVPWISASDLPKEADSVRGDSAEILADWLHQYPEDIQQTLLPPTLDVLIQLLQRQPIVTLCWAISRIGYRRPDIVNELWKVVHHDDDRLGDTALRTLVQLGVPVGDRQPLLDELHHRLTRRISNPLLGALQELADRSTLSIIDQCLHNQATDSKEVISRSLALRVLIAIAERHYADESVQRAVWDMITKIYTSDPKRYTFDLYLGSDLAPHCNDRRIPFQLIRWVQQHLDNSEQASYNRGLLYLRLSECVLPRQLAGIQTRRLLAERTRLRLRQDAVQDSRNTGRWVTRESNLKRQVWDILLYMGELEVLSRELFTLALAHETSGFLKGEIMELLACLLWDPLPNEIVTWLMQKANLEGESLAQELAAHRGVVHMACSAASRQAFEALLHCRITVRGSVLRETANSLASVALHLVQQGERGIVEALFDSLEYDTEEGRKLAAIEALTWIAGNDLLSQSYLQHIVAAVQDERRQDFERSRLAYLLGVMPEESIGPEIVALLQHLAESSQSQTATSALEALAQNGALLNLPRLLESRLSLQAADEQWDCSPEVAKSDWTIKMIGTLYRHDPLNMAPAVATLLKEANMFNLPSLLWMLNSVHSKETTTPPLPNEVSAALLTRLERPQAAMFAVPSELFNTCARLLPDALAVQMWQSHWGSWTPQGRTALAEALSLGTYTTETARVGARRNLLQLMSDAQYSVRRAAYRSMALIDLHLLYLLSGAWLAAPSMELRRRAAEALSWLSETQSPEKEIRVKLLERLATDPDLQIREVVLRSEKEQRERTWMNTYLARIRSTYGKGNQFLLRSWRYAHALTKLGDDTVIAQLQADLSTRKLDLHERHWLRWIISKTQESWKKTNDQWPSAWYTWNGDVIYEQGQFTTSGGTVYTGKCCLYCLSKSTVVEEANWGGAFRLDKPAMTSKGEVVTLKLADRHEGQATIIERLGEIWLFAGAKKLTIGTVWEY